MSNTRYERVRRDAMALSETERAELAEELLDTVSDVTGGFDPAVAHAWRLEIERRIAEIESGDATLLDHDEFIRAIRKVPTAG